MQPKTLCKLLLCEIISDFSDKDINGLDPRSTADIDSFNPASTIHSTTYPQILDDKINHTESEGCSWVSPKVRAESRTRPVASLVSPGSVDGNMQN